MVNPMCFTATYENPLVRKWLLDLIHFPSVQFTAGPPRTGSRYCAWMDRKCRKSIVIILNWNHTMMMSSFITDIFLLVFFISFLKWFISKDSFYIKHKSVHIYYIQETFLKRFWFWTVFMKSYVLIIVISFKYINIAFIIRILLGYYVLRTACTYRT